MDSDPAWKLARYVFECMEHRRESGRVIVSSEESFGSSSDDDSILWTEEFDEELDFISVMMDEDDIALEALVGPFTGAPPPCFGWGPFCNVM